MRILFLNQSFYPDTNSTAQHAADLASALTRAGHAVTVVASRRAYDDPGKRFAARERWKEVDIRRVPCLGFGKAAPWRRALDFGSFLLACGAGLLRVGKQDVVIAMTAPPLVAALGTLVARIRRAEMVLWMMDLNPDELIAAGWLRESSLAARVMERVLRHVLRRSARIIVLDDYMRQRVAARGMPGDRMHVLPPWSHDDAVQYNAAGREAFRREFGLAGKFVVMYSGNHSPCHPLDTLWASARRLADRPEILFCFVGGGSEYRKLERLARQQALSNIRCIPYQPLERLSGSLSAADLHVVVMGDPFVGIVHPCKIYNVLTLGIPFLYIGPSPSHILDLLPPGALGKWAFAARHGDVDGLIDHILAARKAGAQRSQEEMQVAREFSQAALLQRMVEIVAPPRSSEVQCAKECNAVLAD